MKEKILKILEECKANGHDDLHFKEDMEYIANAIVENGTLIELPCKVGDRIWAILGNNIFGRKVKSIVISQNTYITTSNTNGWKELEPYSKEEFGVKWFLTKAEAEARLKELENEE